MTDAIVVRIVSDSCQPWWYGVCSILGGLTPDVHVDVDAVVVYVRTRLV